MTAGELAIAFSDVVIDGVTLSKYHIGYLACNEIATFSRGSGQV